MNKWELLENAVKHIKDDLVQLLGIIQGLSVADGTKKMPTAQIVT